jgi:hypothetical protein
MEILNATQKQLTEELQAIAEKYAKEYDLGIGIGVIISEENEEQSTLAVKTFGKHKPTKLAMMEFTDFIQEIIPTC